MPYSFAIGALSLGAILLSSTPSLADERCKQLDALRVKYAGAELTFDQKLLKVKLVAWFLGNCGKHEVADIKAAAVTSSVH
jgi:hypothetical protein